MWLYFNQQRTLVEQIDHGDEPARVGSLNTFKIFAYFDGIDLQEFTTATIRLRKPDLSETTYPEFPGSIITRQFQNAAPSVTNHFKNGQSYTGFVFNFNIWGLLDTPGLWRATINLYRAGEDTISVSGQVNFNVQDGVYSEEDIDISAEVYQEIISSLAGKMNLRGSQVIRFVEDISDFTFNPIIYSDKDIIFDKETKALYELEWDDQNEEFTYELFQAFEFDPTDPTTEKTSSLVSVSSVDWGTLKTNHFLVSTPASLISGDDALYRFICTTITINDVNYKVTLTKDDNVGIYSGMFFIKESSHLYELTVFLENDIGSNHITFRCATVY